MKICRSFVNILEFFKLDWRFGFFYYVKNYFVYKERDYLGFI